MHTFVSARIEARTLHRLVTQDAPSPLTGKALVTAAVAHLSLDLYEVAADDPKLHGALALFDPQLGMVVVSRDAAAQDQPLHIAHELGHAQLDACDTACSQDDLRSDNDTDDDQPGLEQVGDYGVRERRELRANVFAREFLLPRDVARNLFLDKGFTATDIARILGLPIGLVRQQLFDSLLLPDEAEAGAAPSSDGPPDSSQRAAVEHRGSPFQLQAGPGTGKTRTLVARVLSLLDEGVDPSSILILTYSKRAAAELSQRIERAAKERSTNIWIGTIHQFGLELIRRHHDKLNLHNDPKLLDKSDAIGALEELLPTLDLEHYRNLWEPGRDLAAILGAISRAKDELVDPSAYKALGDEMMQRALSLPPGRKPKEVEAVADAVERAARVLEVARVYQRYEDRLAELGVVDFGDLILLPARLLQFPDVQAMVRQRHQHVLVDEYQDVNRATAEFLKGLVGEGKNLWAVGDARQAIYRFRGASPENVVAFQFDFPGAQVARLNTNYRSTSEIIATFQAFAVGMRASDGLLPLQLHSVRGATNDQPEVRQCATQAEEPLAVAEGIRDLVARGVALRDQAVLCRSNAGVAKIASELEAQNIPVLHLGNLFEREEIRDLLSLVGILIDPWRAGLVRVGRLARYSLSLGDVMTVVDHLRSKDKESVGSLSLSELVAIPGLSGQGRVGLSTLAADLAGLGDRSTPWEVLGTYLLDRSDWLRSMARSKRVSDRMQAIAIWQLVNLARNAPGGGKLPPSVQMLDRVRRLVLLAEDRELRYVPAQALAMDAVRLMTLHGSKGLEFEAVHIPGLVVTSIPLNRQGNACPPPDGLVVQRVQKSGAVEPHAEHHDEEECVFFVGLSRARDHLRLYRHAKTSGAKPFQRAPSPYLKGIEATVRHVSVPSMGGVPSMASTATPIRLGRNFEIDQSAVKAYGRCPRQYMYSHVLKLGASRRRTPVELTTGVVNRVLGWLTENRLTGNPTLDDTEAFANATWLTHGPVGHGFAPSYRQIVSKVIEAVHRASQDRRHLPMAKIPVHFSSGTVMVTPDEHFEFQGKKVWRRIRHRILPAPEDQDHIDALYQMAVASAQEEVGLEAFSLADGTIRAVGVGADLEKFSAGIDGLVGALQRGEFPARPTKFCASCPHYFVCGAVPAGDFQRT